jgi:hypothetical protein
VAPQGEGISKRLQRVFAAYIYKEGEAVKTRPILACFRADSGRLGRLLSAWLPVVYSARPDRARWVSSARIGQIVILGQLAPAIQEHILFLPAEHAALIAERELRQIAREPRWDLQRARFEQLLAARE